MEIDAEYSLTHANRLTVSVCMATCNGSRYVTEQLASILIQLGGEDEVVIVDDASTDDTVTILREIADRRIRLIVNPARRGVVRSFEAALEAAKGEIIFLSDQDDRWFDSKIERFLEEFANPTVTLAVSHAVLMDAEGKPMDGAGRKLQSARGLFATLAKNTYQGSLMAFRRSVLKAATPFPERIAMHDWWIGAVNSLAGKAAVIPEPLVFYRRHGTNVTTGKHLPVGRMIYDRAYLFLQLMGRLPRLMRMRNGS